MQYRHELKHVISTSDMIAIRQRLNAIAMPDTHSVDGKYFIRSLYFDTPNDKALNEKISGVSRRQKFRIRYYNFDKSMISLEKKCKVGGLGLKVMARLSEVEAQNIVDGKIDWMKDSEDELIRELHLKMVSENLRPKTIVDYDREPFIYLPGNVRVTLDYNIRSGLNCVDFLNENAITVPAAYGICIMEVKWDNFLPEIIRDAIQLPSARTESFSKYESCRMPRIEYLNI